MQCNECGIDDVLYDKLQSELTQLRQELESVTAVKNAKYYACQTLQKENDTLRAEVERLKRDWEIVTDALKIRESRVQELEKVLNEIINQNAYSTTQDGVVTKQIAKRALGGKE